MIPTFGKITGFYAEILSHPAMPEALSPAEMAKGQTMGINNVGNPMVTYHLGMIYKHCELGLVYASLPP